MGKGFQTSKRQKQKKQRKIRQFSSQQKSVRWSSTSSQRSNSRRMSKKPKIQDKEKKAKHDPSKDEKSASINKNSSNQIKISFSMSFGKKWKKIPKTTEELKRIEWKINWQTKNKKFQRKKIRLDKEKDLQQPNKYTITRLKVRKIKSLSKRIVYYNGSLRGRKMVFKTINVNHISKDSNGNEKESPRKKRRRYDKIMQDLKRNPPTFVCFQEPEVFFKTHLLPFLQNHRIGKLYQYAYDTYNSAIILSMIPAEFYQINFHGTSTKPMQMCTFDYKYPNGQTLSVILHAVHWKSRIGDEKITQETRAYQKKISDKINKKFDLDFMFGDFNIDDLHPDNYLLKDKLDLQLHHIDLEKKKARKISEMFSQSSEEQSQDYDSMEQESSNQEMSKRKNLQPISYKYGKTPAHKPGDIWTHMYASNGELVRVDRLLIGSRKFSLDQLKKIVNVTYFERIGKESIGEYEGENPLQYLKDRILRGPSDHLGLITQVWFNF